MPRFYFWLFFFFSRKPAGSVHSREFGLRRARQSMKLVVNQLLQLDVQDFSDATTLLAINTSALCFFTSSSQDQNNNSVHTYKNDHNKWQSYTFLKSTMARWCASVHVCMCACVSVWVCECVCVCLHVNYFSLLEFYFLCQAICHGCTKKRMSLLF